jgi:hypothetical protein
MTRTDVCLVVMSLCGAVGMLGCEADHPRAASVVRRYAAPEANQAVAVDSRFFYAIDNRAIGKYDKSSGVRAARWNGDTHGRIAHLNSGVVVDGLLYCAHSNYPDTPMVSSVEVFETNGLTHMRSVSLPEGRGSATWVDRGDNSWWVTFAHYAGRGGEPGKGPEATNLVRFNDEWTPQESWVFPAAVVSRWQGMSSSGGVWVEQRRFYTTGHDAPEIYLLELTPDGHELTLREIIAVESHGQGIALDRAAGLLYSIERRSREVLASSLPR